MYEFQQISIQHNQSSNHTQDKLSTNSEPNFQNSQIMINEDSQNNNKFNILKSNNNMLYNQNECLMNIKQTEKEFDQQFSQKIPNQYSEFKYQKQQTFFQQIYDVEGQNSLRISNKNKQSEQINTNIQLNDQSMNGQSDINEIKEYENIQLFNSDFTRVTLQCNKKEECFTIKKFFKQSDIQMFENEIEIIELFAKEKISLPIISYSKNINDLWYEQNAGQKDFLVIRSQYQKDVPFYNIDFFENIGILFCKLFKKLDRIFELGYAHSDIKPQNIVLGYDLEPYFIDFGGTIQLKDFKKYLNQFTPKYNHQKYYQFIKEKNFYKIYQFLEEKEIKQCDRIQLTISFLFMMIQSLNDKKFLQSYSISFSKLNQYFKEKNFIELIQLITQFKQFNELYQYFEYSYIKDTFMIDDLIQILRIIEQPDNYESIKQRVYQLANLKIQYRFFEEINSENFININDYNINIINIYLDKFDILSLEINQQEDTKFLQNSLQNVIIQNLSKFIEQGDIMIKLIINKTYNDKLIYMLENEYQFDLDIQLNTESQYDVECIQNLKKKFQNSKTLLDRRQVYLQLTNIALSLNKQEFQNILQQSDLIIQEQILDNIINFIKQQCNYINNYFEKNEFVINIYRVDFVNDSFFESLLCHSNNNNNLFKIVLINCRFKSEVFNKLEQLKKCNQNYKIWYQQYNNILNIPQQVFSVKCLSYDMSFQNEKQVEKVKKALKLKNTEQSYFRSVKKFFNYDEIFDNEQDEKNNQINQDEQDQLDDQDDQIKQDSQSEQDYQSQEDDQMDQDNLSEHNNMSSQDNQSQQDNSNTQDKIDEENYIDHIFKVNQDEIQSQLKMDDSLFNNRLFFIILNDKLSIQYQKLLKETLDNKDPTNKIEILIKSPYFSEQIIIIDKIYIDDYVMPNFDGEPGFWSDQILDYFTIIEINNIPFFIQLISKRLLSESFINIDFLSDIDTKWLILSILGEGTKNILDQKVSKYKSKVQKLKDNQKIIKSEYDDQQHQQTMSNILENMQIQKENINEKEIQSIQLLNKHSSDKNDCIQEENEYENTIKEIQSLNQFCKDLNSMFDTFKQQFNKDNLFEKYSIVDFQIDIQKLQQQYSEMKKSLKQQDDRFYESIDKQFNLKVNSLYLSNEFDDWFKKYKHKLDQMFCQILKDQNSDMLNGYEMIQKFQEQNMQIEEID